MSYEHSFKVTVGLEGGYSNNPADRGGETMFGVTAKVARANGYSGPMSDMSIEVAKQIYKAQYWDVLRLDAVDAVSEYVSGELFDTAVNMGVGTAGRFLQRSLNVLNRDGRDFHDVEVDGVVGPMTLAALSEYMDNRGDRGAVVLVRLLDGLQAARYVEIAENDPSQEVFMFGWVLNRIGNCDAR